MADIELVIKIDDEIYKKIKNNEFWLSCGLDLPMAYGLIKNGTPIPDNATNGEWIIDRKVVDKSRRPTTYQLDVHCSECGFKYAYTTDKEDSIPTNYCPNCGVHMKGANR